MVRLCTLLCHVSLWVLLLCSIAGRTTWAQVPREIFIDVPVSGRIESSTEKRYYFVQISGTGPLFLHLQKSRGADVGVAVYHNSLNSPPVQKIEDRADILLVVDAPQPGVYYIVVYPFWPSLGLPVNYTLTTWVLPFNEVTGAIDLLDYGGDITQIPVLIQIRNPGEVTPIGQHEVLLESSGRFYFVTSLEGVYDLAAKAPHWLRRVEPGVQITSSTVVNFTLVNGDIDGDNEVTLFDFGQLVAAFGSAPGAPHWNANADLDGDEEVTLFDFGVLVRNFGAIGDE